VFNDDFISEFCHKNTLNFVFPWSWLLYYFHRFSPRNI